MPRKKSVKRSVKKSVKKVSIEPEKKLTYYQRAKKFVNSNKKRLIQGTAGLVSVATIAFLVNKYMKNGATREEAEKIAAQETGVNVEVIKQQKDLVIEEKIEEQKELELSRERAILMDQHRILTEKTNELIRKNPSVLKIIMENPEKNELYHRLTDAIFDKNDMNMDTKQRALMSLKTLFIKNEHEMQSKLGFMNKHNKVINNELNGTDVLQPGEVDQFIDRVKSQLKMHKSLLEKYQQKTTNTDLEKNIEITIEYLEYLISKESILPTLYVSVVRQIFKNYVNMLGAFTDEQKTKIFNQVQQLFKDGEADIAQDRQYSSSFGKRKRIKTLKTLRKDLRLLKVI